MPYIDLTEQELLALYQAPTGEPSNPDALASAQAKIEPMLSTADESSLADDWGEGDGESVESGGYEFELVVKGSTDPDPVSPDEESL
jgi:hypothetical protein